MKKLHIQCSTEAGLLSCLYSLGETTRQIVFDKQTGCDNVVTAAHAVVNFLLSKKDPLVGMESLKKGLTIHTNVYALPVPKNELHYKYQQPFLTRLADVKFAPSDPEFKFGPVADTEIFNHMPCYQERVKIPGKSVVVTKHAFDRFKVRNTASDSALSAFKALKKLALSMKPVDLPEEVRIRKDLKYQTTGEHYSDGNGTHFVVEDQTLVTIYYRKKG